MISKGNAIVFVTTINKQNHTHFKSTTNKPAARPPQRLQSRSKGDKSPKKGRSASPSRKRSPAKGDKGVKGDKEEDQDLGGENQEGQPGSQKDGDGGLTVEDLRRSPCSRISADVRVSWSRHPQR